MEVLLRQLRPLPDGQLEYQDTELAAEEVLIGSAPQCQIQWVGEGIAPRHASLRYSASGAVLKCRRGYRIHVNGRPTAGGVLGVSDGPHLGPPPLGFVTPPAGNPPAGFLTANGAGREAAPRLAPTTLLRERRP